MNKRLAKKYAAGILSLEDFGAIVEEQVGGANIHLAHISAADRQKIAEAANEIAYKLHQAAGDDIMNEIVGKKDE